MGLLEILWSVKEGLAKPEELAILEALGLVFRSGDAYYLTRAGEIALNRGKKRDIAA